MAVRLNVSPEFAAWALGDGPEPPWLERARRLYWTLVDDPDSLSVAELREVADSENPETLHRVIEVAPARLEDKP